MVDESRTMSDQGPVLTCQKTDCAYNQSECCFAMGIEVGDEHPMCDTYTHSASRMGQELAAVMTCKVQDCHFNQGRECHAAGITVGEHSGHADCLTARMS